MLTLDTFTMSSTANKAIESIHLGGLQASYTFSEWKRLTGNKLAQSLRQQGRLPAEQVVLVLAIPELDRLHKLNAAYEEIRRYSVTRDGHTNEYIAVKLLKQHTPNRLLRLAENGSASFSRPRLKEEGEAAALPLVFKIPRSVVAKITSNFSDNGKRFSDYCRNALNYGLQIANNDPNALVNLPGIDRSADLNDPVETKGSRITPEMKESIDQVIAAAGLDHLTPHAAVVRLLYLAITQAEARQPNQNGNGKAAKAATPATAKTTAKTKAKTPNIAKAKGRS